jgi:hypothetical protein
MGLHRDIFWLGRQWAVTGDGLQLIDQRLEGFFDIAVSRLWEDAAIEGIQAKQWLNHTDFANGLEQARARYPKQCFIEGSAPLPREAPPVDRVAIEVPPEPPSAPAMQPEQIRFAPINLRAQGLGSAKFQRPWRIGARRR